MEEIFKLTAEGNFQSFHDKFAKLNERTPRLASNIDVIFLENKYKIVMEIIFSFLRKMQEKMLEGNYVNFCRKWFETRSRLERRIAVDFVNLEL